MATRHLVIAAALAATLAAPAMAQSQSWTGGEIMGRPGQYTYSSPGPDGGRVIGGYIPGRGGQQTWSYTPNRRSTSCADLGTCTQLPSLPQPGDDDE